MPEAQFTVHDTPALAARIRGDMERVLKRVRAADPRLRALVLTGGFARGEGAVLGNMPQNDYDFVALRGLGPSRVPYPQLRTELEAELGLHVDLAPVGAWRLRWVRRSIFWYETALRGRVLWGDDLLPRIRVRDASRLEPTEGLRLLVNRGAGLLLVTPRDDPHAHRLQAAKALLAVLDAHMLARGAFPPSQTERWRRFEAMAAGGEAPRALVALRPWLEWAYAFKVDPGAAPERDATEAWRTAARAVLDAVPVGLRHAGMSTLAEYERRDGLIDRLHYFQRAARIPGAQRFVLHPTGRVRVATLRLLQASVDGVVRDEAAEKVLAPLARVDGRPLRLLEDLRGATLQ